MKNGFKTFGNIVLWVCVALTIFISVNSYIKVSSSASENVGVYTKMVDELTEFKNTEFYALSEYSGDPSKLLDELMKYSVEDFEFEYTPLAGDYMWCLQQLHSAALSSVNNPESYVVVYEFVPAVGMFAKDINNRINVATSMLKLQDIVMLVSRIILCTLIIVIVVVVGKAVYTAMRVKKDEPVLLTKEYEDTTETSTEE